MKPTTLTSRPFLLGLVMFIITFTLASWNHKPNPGQYQQFTNDTVPKARSDKHEKKVRDLDDVLNELNNEDIKTSIEKAQKEIMESMKNFDGEKLSMEIANAMKGINMDEISKRVNESVANIDWSKISKDVNNAMANVDWNKMRKDMDESMSKVNWDEINKEVNEAMTRVDWDKMKEEMDASMSKVNWDKMHIEVNEAMSKIDWSQMNSDLSELKNMKLDKLDLDLKKMGEELKNLGPELEKAREGIETAKAEVKEYRDFVNGLDNDGLINKKEDYSIKHKEGELIINGKKASNEVYTKYRNFLEKHKTFHIEKNGEDFNMDMK
jgi:hypothetical protein